MSLWPFPPHKGPCIRIKSNIFISGTFTCWPRGMEGVPSIRIFVSGAGHNVDRAQRSALPSSMHALWTNIYWPWDTVSSSSTSSSRPGLWKSSSKPEECGLPMNSSVREMPPKPLIIIKITGNYSNLNAINANNFYTFVLCLQRPFMSLIHLRLATVVWG